MRELIPVLNVWLILPVCMLILSVIGGNQAHATHAAGADLRYECVGPNTYQFTLTVYRDCQGSNLNNQQNIGFESASCGEAKFIVPASRTTITELSPICPAQQPLSTCNGGILPGVEEHIYQVTYTLPQECEDWRISWHLCCRTLAITNSIITSTTRMYIEAYLDNLNVICNNSPYFENAPVPYLCDGQLFLYNNGAVDPDGDSLAFELVNPLDYLAIQGQVIPVPYETGFTTQYPMTTNPPNTFNFNDLTGQFSFTPDGLQQGIVALLVKEYRDGVLIGSTMRDMQMVVLNCLNDPPTIEEPVNITGGQYNNGTFSVCAGNTLNFDIGGFDDPGDLLDIQSNVANLPAGASFGIVGNNPFTGSFSWPTTLADTGVHYFNLDVDDDGCPIIGSATKGFQIVVRTGEVLPPIGLTFCPNTDSSIQLNTSIPNSSGIGTYSWDPPGDLSNPTIPDPVLSLSGAGVDLLVTYDPNVTGECLVTQQVSVNPDLTIELSPNPGIICVGDTVQLNANVSGSASYLWSPAGSLSATNVSNPLAFPTTSTVYTVLVQTISCAYVDSVSVLVDQAPTLNPMPDPDLCFGNSVQLPGGGNLGTSTFSWSPILGLDDPSSLTPIATPSSTTTYTLTAQNSCGTASEQITVNVAPPISLSLSSEDLTCNGGNDGSILAITFGGGGLPVFDWGGLPGTGPSQTNLGAGTYTVSVVDGSNCVDTATVTLSEPPPLLLTLDTLINNTCAGAQTGEISVTASGGTPGYTYSIDGINFYNLSTFINLATGTYAITVRDANECEETLTGIVVTEPLSPVVAVVDSITNTDCNNNLGAIYTSASGGTPLYSFSLNGDTANAQAGGVFLGLQPGFYQILVADENGCTDTTSTEIVEVADPFLVLDSLGNISCYNGSDGFISVTPGSGTPPYSFILDGALPAVPNTFFDNLAAGPHEVLLVDDNGCRYGLNVFLTQPDSLYGIIGAQSDISCEGSMDGSVAVLAFGGVEPYSYALNVAGPFGPDSSFTDLPAGPLTIFLQDANDCPAEVPAILLEPVPIGGLLLSQTDVSCFGLSDGSFLLTGTGGTPDYEYLFPGAPAYVDSGAFENLPAGDYTILIRDAEGCVDSVVVTINEPGPLAAEVTDLTMVDCFEAASGAATISPNGGTPPYFFAYDSVNFDASPTVSGLREGTYVILVQDSRGCMTQVEATIEQPEELLGDIIPLPITCFGDDDGRGAAIVQGGTPPYSYAWTNGETDSIATNLPPGNHIALVTDDNGCQVSLTTEIIEPPLMNIDTTMAIDVSCFGLSDGLVQIGASGGLPPLSYTWSNGSADSLQTGVPAGIYTVAVEDTNGCLLEDTLIVEEPDSIGIRILRQEPAFCGLPTGLIEVEASGGVGGFAYQWNTIPPQDSSVAVELLGGSAADPYTVVVTDTNGCTNALTTAVDVTGSPEAAFYTNYTPLDSFMYPEAGVRFTNISKDGAGYKWDFGDGRLSQEVNPTHIYPDTGYYEVELVAFDPNFVCPDTARLGIYLFPPGEIYVPTAFTPNGDGINDHFFPVGIGVEEVEMKIFSRWGLHITTLYSMDETWDGYLWEGGAAPEGVYVWVIRAVINDGRVFEDRGTVTLFR
jgi:gliding motility-associated-like protein